MIESDILAETENLYLCREHGALKLCLKGATHAAVIGRPRDIEAATQTMARLERYPKNLRAMHAHY